MYKRQVKGDITNTIHPILTSSSSNNIYSNPVLSNTENVFFRRLSDNRALADRTYRLRYVIPKTELNARPPLIGYVVKRKSGQPTHFTMIKNYPVQGFSNDIVQVIYLELNERLEPLQSCVVNSVHDSIVVDVHPNETNYVIQIIKDMNNDLDLIIEEAYNVKMNVPLLLEAKIGSNWLDIKDVI